MKFYFEKLVRENFRNGRMCIVCLRQHAEFSLKTRFCCLFA